MSFRFFATVLCVVGVGLVGGGPVRGQEDPAKERGFDPEKAYSFGQVDHVNLFNGNLAVTIPFGPRYPVGGELSYGLNLVYNSNVWDYEDRVEQDGTVRIAAYPTALSNAGLGWTAGFGRLFRAYGIATDESQGHLTYVTPDGAQHTFYDTPHADGSVPGSMVRYTRDGSYIRAVLAGTNPEAPTAAAIHLPDGTIQEFVSVGTGELNLVEIRDWTGNNRVTISRSEDGASWLVNDGHRSSTLHWTTVAGTRVLDHVDFAGPSGLPDPAYRWDLRYEVANIAVSCKNNDPANGGTNARVNVARLKQVVLPSSETWEFTYNSECSPAVDALPGTLQWMRMPTRGWVGWTWQEWSNGGVYDGPLQTLSQPAGVATREIREKDGSTCATHSSQNCEWFYFQEPDAIGRALRTRVRHPSGAPNSGPPLDESVHYFSADPNIDPANWLGWDFGLPFAPGRPGQGGHFLSSEQYEGLVGSGQLLRQEWVKYEKDRLMAVVIPPGFTENGQPEVLVPISNDPRYPSDNWHWYNTNRRLVSSRTVYNDDLRETSPGVFEPTWEQTTYADFDGLGHYRTAVHSGNFSTAGGYNPNSRTDRQIWNPERGTYSVDHATNTTTGNWNPIPAGAAWLPNLYQHQTIFQHGTSQREWFCWDDDGLLKSKRTYSAGTGESGTDVLIVYTRDSRGDVTREDWYGGDARLDGSAAAVRLDGISTTNCALAGLPAPAYSMEHQTINGVRSKSTYLNSVGDSAASHPQLDLTVDKRGLVTASRDSADVATGYQWDPLHRLTYVIAPSGRANVNYAWTNATNSQNARVTISETTSTGLQVGERQVVFDSQGRVESRRRKFVMTPDGTTTPSVIQTKTTTYYDAMGWVHRESQERDDDPKANTTYRDYDPFGRPGTVTPPDGEQHDVKFTYRGKRLVERKVRVGTTDNEDSTTEFTTTEEYDRWGKLFSVTEPAGGTYAQYTYDIGGRLKRVNHSAGGVTQTRLFLYDNRGFLNQECHPEKGAGNTCGGASPFYVRHSNYDALGNPGITVDGPSTVSRRFDRASRPTYVFDNLGRTLKSWVYSSCR